MNKRTQELIKQFATDLLNRSGYDMREYEPFLEEAEKFVEQIALESARVVYNTDLEHVNGGDSAVLGAAADAVRRHFGVKQ